MLIRQVFFKLANCIKNLRNFFVTWSNSNNIVRDKIHLLNIKIKTLRETKFILKVFKKNFKSTIREFPRSCSNETKQHTSMQHRTNTFTESSWCGTRILSFNWWKRKKEREKGEIKTKNRKKGGRNAVKRVARRVEQCVINVKREPRANRFERVSLLRTRSPRPLAIFLLFRIQAESKVVLRPPFFDARILKPETPF